MPAKAGSRAMTPHIHLALEPTEQEKHEKRLDGYLSATQILVSGRASESRDQDPDKSRPVCQAYGQPHRPLSRARVRVC
jgi:hypothetical protein